MRVPAWLILPVIVLSPQAGNHSEATDPVTLTKQPAALQPAALPDSPAIPSPSTAPALAARESADTTTTDIDLSGSARYPAKADGTRVTTLIARNLGDGTTIDIDVTDNVRYKVFTLKSPERLVVDLYDVSGMEAIAGYYYKDPRIIAVRMGQFDERTLRLVFDLKAALPVADRLERREAGGNYRLTLTLGQVVMPVDAPPVATAPMIPEPVAIKPPAPPELPASTAWEHITPGEAFIPVVLNGQSLGETHTVIGDGPDSSHFDATAIFDALASALSDEAINQLRHRLGSRQNISFTELAAEGISARIDPGTVSAILEVDPRRLRTRRINLHGLQPELPDDGSIIKPAPFSAALQVFATQDWDDDGRLPFGSELDGNIDIHGWVLQNRSGYLEDSGEPWQRRETQLIKDWTAQQRRLSVGDLNYQVTGLMGLQPLSGISYGTLFDLQPYSLSYPLSHHEFFLESDSRVDIYINGIQHASQELATGPHDVYDLPLVDGINAVMLRITDRYGRAQELHFFETQDQRLLRPGLSQYSVTVGVPRNTNTDGSLNYDRSTTALSYFYRRGLTSLFTLGGHLEGDESLSMAGVTGVWSTHGGTIAFDLARSRDRDASEQDGKAARLDYLYRSRRWSFTTGYEWQAENFATLGQTAADNNPHTAARISFSFPPIMGWSNTLSFNYREMWDSQNSRSNRLMLTRGLNRNWYLNVDIGYQNQDEARGIYAGFQLYWAPPSSRLHANAGYTSLNQESTQQIEYTRLGELGADARSVIRSSSQFRTAQLEAGYVNSYLSTRAASSSVHSQTGTDSTLTSLSLGTAAVYVGGEFAVTRPLNGLPFAVLKGMPSLGVSRSGIMRGYGTQPFAMLQGAGSKVVLPNLSPYYVSDINVDLGELAMDTQIEQQTFKVLPSYRSGTLLKVGLEGEVYALGQLENVNGKPLAYVAGLVESLDEPSAEPVQAFTDKNGHFEITGLKAGRYRLRIMSLPGTEAVFTVPIDSYGMLDVGTLTLSDAVRP